jgi:hypothetical protein
VSYIRKSIAPGEVLHYQAHFHWLYHAAAWGALILGAIGAVLAFSAESLWPALLSLAVGGAVYLAIMLPIWTTEIGVTNQRIIYKRGFIERDTNELQLGSIEQVSFNQDFWGRIFDYGRLELHGTGDDDIMLPAVGDPLALRSALQSAIGAARGENGVVPPGDRAPQPEGLRVTSA